MKTAQIIRRFAFSEWGGTECVVWNTSKQLIAQGDETAIFATTALEKTQEEKKEEVSIRRFPYFYPYFPLTEAQKTALDKKGGNPCVPGLTDALVNGEFNLLHCHNMGRIAGMTRAAAQKCGIPYVMSFHGGCFDVPENELREMLRPTRRTLRYGGILDRLFHLRGNPVADADGLLCVGRNELAPTRERFPDKPVEYLPNGVDVEHFRTPSPVNFREKYGIPANRKLLLNISRIDYQKNQRVLVEMLDRLLNTGRSCHLVLIGPPTSAWYYESLQKEIAERNLGEFVTIIPGLPPDSPDLPAAYQSADLFFLPSAHEPFGIVILEAWSAGVPVIAAPVGGINYLIRDGENGFLIPSAETARMTILADNLLFGNGRELTAKIRANALNEAMREYSWETISRRLSAFYQMICSKKKTI